MSDSDSPSVRAARRERLLGLMSSTWLSQGCYVLAKLGLPDLMAESPHSAEALAERSGADPVALQRLLAALASAGLLSRTESGAYGLTPMTEFLRSGGDDSARDTAILYGEEVFRCFGEILHTVRTGEPAFPAVFGMPFYDYLGRSGDAANTCTAAMGAQPVPEAALECGIPDRCTVVDLGGGNGRLLAALLDRAPGRRGVLLELPAAARQAKAWLADRGLLDRVDIVEGSFFDRIPARGDVYLLSRVLHNWADDRALAVLNGIRSTAPEGSRLIVLERFLDAPPARRSATAARANMVDLLMLVMLEGHDRGEAEYRTLLERSGFRVVASHGPPPGSVESALEAVAVS